MVWLVDPYGTLGRNTIGIYAESERQAKPGMLRASKAHKVLIGSSKVAYVDPAPLGPGAFNASFSAAMPEEILDFLRRYVAPGSTVVIGLDAFMMNAAAYPLSPDTFAEDPSGASALSYVFGLRPAWAATQALVLHARGRPAVLKRNGQRDPTDRMARNAAMKDADYGPWLDYLRTRQFAGFAYSQDRITALEDILSLARDRKLTLFAFINPLSDPVRRLLESLPARGDIARFRTDVQAALPGTVDLSHAPGLGEPALYFRFDPFHYLPETGDLVLRTVLAHPPVYRPPFGVVRGDDYSGPSGTLTLNPAPQSRAGPGASPTAVHGPSLE